MLLCICSVIDPRWCQNVIRTTKWHKAIDKCATDVLTTVIWMSLVIFYWTDAQQHGIYMYLFSLIKRQRQTLMTSSMHLSSNISKVRTKQKVIWHSSSWFKTVMLLLHYLCDLSCPSLCHEKSESGTVSPKGSNNSLEVF